MEGIIKEAAWRKGSLVCSVDFGRLGIVNLSLDPEQLADMGCGYAQRDIENAFDVCHKWINVCDRGQNAGMLRQLDLDVVQFRRAKEILNEIKARKLKVKFVFA